MSFEGYYQQICENGHYTTQDANYSEPSEHCKICHAPLAFVNLVDDTNCEQAGCIYDFEKLSEEKAELCQCCGSVKIVEEATYKIPTEEWKRNHQTYINEEGQVIFCNDHRSVFAEDYAEACSKETI